MEIKCPECGYPVIIKQGTGNCDNCGSHIVIGMKDILKYKKNKKPIIN
jgi:uncharacterized Zn finger protein (UPF0148 family)